MKKHWGLSIAITGIFAVSLAGAQVLEVNPAKAAVAQPSTGAWLRADQLALQQQVQQHSATGDAAQDDSQTWLPVMQEFKALIDNDPELYMLFTQMFEQIPRTPPFLNDPVGNPQVRHYSDLLRLINQTITRAPEFNTTDLVGFPINAIVNWAMGTPAGAAAFLNDKVNRQLKKVLAQWAVYLRSADSLAVLNTHPEKGWFGRDALQAMPTLVQDFVVKPDLPHYGFTSWGWHSPVSGRIVKTRLIDGSYYAQTPAVGFDPAGPNESQGYITQVASRGVIFIEADNPKIGLMAVLFVGMAEVSSNDITVYEGQRIKKGDQLGMFHFGGSTHALIFRPQVKLDFDLRGQTPSLNSKNIPVRAKIASVQ